MPHYWVFKEAVSRKLDESILTNDPRLKCSSFVEKFFTPRRFKFVRSFVRSFIYSFIHSLLHLFIHWCFFFFYGVTWKLRSNVGGTACLRQLWVLSHDLNNFILKESCGDTPISSLNKTLPNRLTETTVQWQKWNISNERDKSVRIPKRQMAKLGGLQL